MLAYQREDPGGTGSLILMRFGTSPWGFVHLQFPAPPAALFLPLSNLLVLHHIPRQAAAWKASSLMLFSKILKRCVIFLLAELLVVTMKGGRNQTAGKTDCRY